MDREAIRNAVLSAQDIKIEPVPTPEWPDVNGFIFVRSLSARSKEVFLDSLSSVQISKTGTGANVDMKVFKMQSGIKLVAMTACDESGELLFTLEDVQALGDKNAEALQRVIDATGDLNGFSDKARTAAKNVSTSVTVEDRPTVSSTV